MNKSGNVYSPNTLKLNQIDLLAISKIYSQTEMCELYNVSRATLQRAVKRQRETPIGSKIDKVTSEELEGYFSVGAWAELKQTSTYQDWKNKS